MRIQRWLGPSIALIIGIASSLAPVSVAEAQGWMGDRSRREGPGFRLGDFELHPGLGVEVGYDSNLYYSGDGAAGPASRDSGILRATAHLDVATRGRQRATEGESGGGGADSGGASSGAAQLPVTFRGGLSGSFYTFFNDIDRSNMEVDANLALNILPGRVFSINITEQFGRSIRPFTENTTRASFGRINNQAGLRINLATTGDVLKFTVGYNFGLDFFEAGTFQYGNRFTHRLSLRETFRFLPQTAIIHDTRVVFLDYFGNTAAAPTLVNNGMSLQTRIGLNGAFTQDFSVMALVGYSAGWFDSRGAAAGVYDQEYESVNAQVQARWQIERDIRLTFGYDRDFQPSFLGNFYRRDRGSAAFQMLIDGRFLLGVDASFGYYEFGRAVESDGSTPVGSTAQRGDFRLIASLFAEYRFTEWLGLNATLRYTGNFTDYQYLIDDMMGMTIIDPAGFNKFEAWLGVRVFY